ncbi:hypothetical protein [Polaromonas sp. JS666]|nr:hypothetical protein [Polaromonas sp. JS666]SDN73279.1 hypothetical protein SAMN05720382_10775 [Polaromonas sp. JS666]
MDSALDSLTWDEELSPHRKGRRSLRTWIRRILVVLTGLFVLGVLLSS